MARDCRGTKRNRGRDAPMTKEKMMKMFKDMMVQCNKKSADFQTITRRIISKSDNDKCEINVKSNKNHLLHNVGSLQLRVNDLNIKTKKIFVRFKVKQRNLFGLALINTGNLVHSVIVSGEFWEAIGGKNSNSMDYKVGTADGQKKDYKFSE